LLELWNSGPVALMLNSLVVLSSYLFGSFGLTIVVLTIIIRGAMYPLTVKQLRATRAMQALQPKIAELQKKYAKDKQRLAQEQMKLYKQSGVSPAGCAVPMLIQFPIWIALYQSIIRVLATTPEALLGLSRYLWSWPVVYSMLPLDNNFLWFNLVGPNLPLAILVGATMWLTQKMVTPTTTDPQQRSQSQLMLWMMPLMFGFIAMSVPSGLALYWLVSNVISMVIQYFVLGGWGGLARGGAGKYVVPSSKDIKVRVAEAETAPHISAMEADIVDTGSTDEEESGYGGAGDKRQPGRGGYPDSLRAFKPRSRRGKGRRPKRR
jgi:YidC/Oxa1 family membrane protein insertase